MHGYIVIILYLIIINKIHDKDRIGQHSSKSFKLKPKTLQGLQYVWLDSSKLHCLSVSVKFCFYLRLHLIFYNIVILVLCFILYILKNNFLAIFYAFVYIS